MANKYKVEIKQTDTFVVDVEAENEEQAKEFALEQWNGIAANGTQHYYQQGDTEVDFGTVYDVTGTDDAV